MNSRAVLNLTNKLVIEHIRSQLKEPIKVGDLSDLVNKELASDNGFWVRLATARLEVKS